MISIQHFVFSPFAENTYVLFDETKECVVIDPGCQTKYEQEILANFIDDNDLKPVKLLNTHCHIDHVFGNQFIKETYQVKLYMHQLDVQTLKSNHFVAKMYNIQPFIESEPDVFVEEGEKIQFGHSELDILFVPGHAPGHIAFVSQAQRFTISGDVLFKMSIGRTDFPNCSHEDLMNSIKNKMLPLGDDFMIYSGHGPVTTIGFERENNPFLR